MDCKGIEGDGLRTKSFRNKSYNNRRVFLRSYPLQWGEQDEYNKEEPLQLGQQDGFNKEDKVRAADGSNQENPMKKIILSVFHWGGEKFLFLRRVKHMIAVHVIACIPVGFKTPTALITA
ncbi:hypothetical protein FH972_005827 [Carpinus fangiana]|uniref:Uncharacterized protein n=1 Tax=Carpinus fangiana TaxID=176857 RepID=A0A5N6QTQ1_9ROSI|nr:hypothetical protein FH972_005827 [Carpinus fangiana]